MVEDIRLVKGAVTAYQSLSLYEGQIRLNIPEETNPVLHWKGAKLPYRLWKIISSFLRWTQDEHRSESQLRLYYSPERGKWKAIVLPQRISHGLSTEELREHPGRELAFAAVSDADGWYPAGTVHHHCNASAFQSGTDHRDEIAQNGLHITLGDLGSDKYTIHYRATFRGIVYDIDPQEWVDFTDEEACTPVKCRFPKLWRDHVLEYRAPKRDNASRRDAPVWYVGGNQYDGWDYGSDEGYDTYEQDEMEVITEIYEGTIRLMLFYRVLDTTATTGELYGRFCAVLDECCRGAVLYNILLYELNGNNYLLPLSGAIPDELIVEFSDLLTATTYFADVVYSPEVLFDLLEYRPDAVFVQDTVRKLLHDEPEPPTVGSGGPDYGLDSVQEEQVAEHTGMLPF